MRGLESRTTRRRLVKAGIAAGAVLVGGASLITQSDVVVAAQFKISDAAPVTNADGDIDYVRLEAMHNVKWQGFDTAVEYIHYKDRVIVRPDDEDKEATVSEFTSDHLDEWSNPGSGEGNSDGPVENAPRGAGKKGQARKDFDWNIIGNPNADDPDDGGPRANETPAPYIDLLDEETDGETNVSKIVFEREAWLLDGDKKQLAGPDGPHDPVVASDDFEVEVTNQGATTDAWGNGDASAGTGKDD